MFKAGGLPFPRGVRASLSQKHTSKAEDLAVTVAGPVSAAFAVYDGHGGLQAAQTCVNSLTPKLLALSSLDDDEAIIDAFWDVDAELGVRKIFDGTTATVLLVANGEDDDDTVGESSSSSLHCTARPLRCVLAHVGDSSAIRLNMHSANSSELLISETTQHLASSVDEQKRIKHLWATRRALWGKEAVKKNVRRSSSAEELMITDKDTDGLRSIDESLVLDEQTRPQRLEKMPSIYGSLPGNTPYMHPTLAAVSEAAIASVEDGQELSPEYLRVLWRAFRRETAINAHARKAFGVRMESGIQRRGHARGPFAISTTLPNGQMGANTCVSRSIGDWDAARSVLPHPDIEHFKVPAGEFHRVVIASDGVWDHMTAEEVAKIARTTRRRTRVPQAVLSVVLDRSRRKFGQLSDDSTVVCIDLDATGDNLGRATRETSVDSSGMLSIDGNDKCCSVQ